MGPEPAFREIAAAIEAVGCADYNDHEGHEGSVHYEAVRRRMRYGKGDSKPESTVKNAYPCICRHVFMGCYRGHLRHAHQVHDKGQQREMQDHAGRRNTGRIYGHLIIYEPQTDRLRKSHYDKCKGKLYDHRRRIHLVQLRLGALSHFICDEALDCGVECTGDDGEHGYDAANDIVDAVVVFSERRQDHTRSVESYKHQREHPDVKHQGVSGYARTIMISTFHKHTKLNKKSDNAKFPSLVKLSRTDYQHLTHSASTL